VASVWRVIRSGDGGLEVVSILNWDVDERQPERQGARQWTSTGDGLVLSQDVEAAGIPTRLSSGRAIIPPTSRETEVAALICAMCAIETDESISTAAVPAGSYMLQRAYADPLRMEDANRRWTFRLDGVAADLALPGGLPALLAAIAKADLDSMGNADPGRQADLLRERLIRSLRELPRSRITLEEAPAARAQGGSF
jgi:hypothetical protein